MIEEFFDVLDKDGNMIGQVCPRNTVHKNGYFHATVHVWVVNESGNILLQKRSMQKDTHPGLWDISCAGHLSAGDTPLDAAVRELYEELGISIDTTSRFQFLFRVFKSYISPDQSINDNEFSDVFILRVADTEKIRFCTEEISEVKFVSLTTLGKMVSAADRELVPHYEEYGKILEYLKSTTHTDSNFQEI
ncbi:MAG TPA: NUDIX domain-containing protein [Chitinispirillaceae bacterium]|nr:NUDIX domain-containing protein [Chitinispirillaceae bacterium]